MKAKNIRTLIIFWIGTVAIAYLAGYVPKQLQLRDDRAQIANLNSKLDLTQLQSLAGSLYLQTSERNYGLAEQTSSEFFNQLRTFVNQVDDTRLKQMLMELSNSQDEINAGIANGDPTVLPKVEDLLRKTLLTGNL